MRRRVRPNKKNRKDQAVQRQTAEPSSTQHPLLGLQKTAGNNATQRLIQSQYIQSKLQAPNTSNISASVSGAVQESKGSPLPESSRAFFEPRLGSNFHQVQIHSDAHAGSAAKAMNAKAFTVNNQIMFGENQYSPESHSGKRLLAHELTHIAQQSNAGPSVHNVVQHDLLDDLGEGVSSAAESAATVAESIGSEVGTGVESAGSAIEQVVQTVNQEVQDGIDEVVSTVTSNAKAVSQVLDSAGEKVEEAVGSVVSPAQDGQAGDIASVDWNSPPALVLKKWSLQQNPEVFRGAQGNPSSLLSKLHFPPDVMQAIEELAAQSRSDVVAVQPAPISQPAPVSGPVSTGPVSGVRPVTPPSPGTVGLLGRGGVVLIFFIIGFVLPFLIGYVVEHSEETSEQPDPDVKTLPGGVGTQNDPSDAGAPTSSTNPSPKTDPQPDTRDPREEKCRDTFRNASNNPTHANPLECDHIPMLQVIEQGLQKPKFMVDNPGRFKFGTPRVSQQVEDADACEGGPSRTFHVPIIDTRTNQPVPDVEVSIFECTCCDEEGNLSVVFERPHISGGRR